MQKRILVDEPCPDCKKKNVKHTAKGLCSTCYKKVYMREYRDGGRSLEGEVKVLKMYDGFQKDKPHCLGCGEYPLETNLVKSLCKSCYSGWFRQKAKWHNRTNFVYVGPKTGAHRNIALKLFGKFPFCHECGVRQWGWKTGGKKYLKTKLITHHLDGNHENNTPENLMPLCAIHHAEYHKKLSPFPS